MEEKICGIYCIQNKVNQKRIIGQSIDMYSRWKQHKSKLIKNKHYNKYLQRAWNKYGEENFEFSILEECENKKEILNEREIYWIAFYNTFLNRFKGYNETPGGDGLSKVSQYIKNKISKTLSGRKLSMKHRQNISKYLKGRSYEQRFGEEKASKLKKEMSIRMTINNPMKGKTCPNYIFIPLETKLKIIEYYTKENMTLFKISTILNINNTRKIKEILLENNIEITKHVSKPKHACPICQREIDSANYNRHFISHQIKETTNE